MNKTQAAILVTQLASMTEADFKLVANVLRTAGYVTQLAVFETACRFQGQTQQCLQKRG